MCLFSQDMPRNEGSPDRVDALVWGMTSLFDKIVSRRKAKKDGEIAEGFKTQYDSRQRPPITQYLDGLILKRRKRRRSSRQLRPSNGSGDGFRDLCPEGFDTPEGYLEDLRQDYELDVEADHDNRAQAIDDKNFAAGNQWDPIVLEQRQGLPCLVINSIPQFTAQVVGDWRSNRNAVKVLPSENGDVDVASSVAILSEPSK
jgi:hypothetical protein